MNTKTRLALGALLAILGAAWFVIGPSLGATLLPDPWSFIAGFLLGVAAGTGVVLSIDGLIRYRRGK